MKTNDTAPSWSLSSAYSSIDSAEFKADREFVETSLPRITAFCSEIAGLDLDSDVVAKRFAQTIRLRETCDMLAYNLGVFTGGLNSVDTTMQDVVAMDALVGELKSRVEQAAKPLDNFLANVDDEFIEKLLSLPDIKPFGFHWKNARKMKDFLLSDAEETLLEGLGVTGHTTWMTLYYQLVGNMKCTLTLNGKEQILGLAETSAILYGSSEADRKPAWHAIQKSWTENKVAASAIVNALAGWRIEVAKKRAHTKPMNFLTQALHDNRIQEETLNAIITCCRENLPQIKRATLALAKVAGKAKLDPWDLVASCPAVSESGTTLRSYDEGMQLVQESFSALNPEMEAFAKMMHENSWIDAKVLPTKSTGGYCTEFSKTREPRIFMTYQGSTNDISTLAHELGHAYHYWVMRDIPRPEAAYPSTLAETASVFAEQTLREHLTTRSKNKDEILEAGWSEMASIAAYLIDIPSRFEFEKKFHEQREKQTLSADELSKLMEEVRHSWFGDTFSSESSLYWATKLHFSIAGSGFYNFAYAFGYLFAMSLYARRKERGESFNETYVAILRDTGRMTAEDLIQKHLGENIRKPQFWQKSVDLAIAKIADFEKVIA